MQSKNEPIRNAPNMDKLSLAAQVFAIPYFFSEAGFKPSFFETKELHSLSLTSKTRISDATPKLKQRELLTYVVLGEQTKAEAMIKANPKLLLIKSQTEDYSGKTIIATPFQAAIGAGDKPMWEMMLPYFEGLEPGEASRQFREWFPNGIEDTPFSELQTYYNAIALDIVKDQGLLVIKRFRKDIPCQKVIKQGKHFNLQHLIAAYQAYIIHFDVLDNWDYRDLFWQKVIGYVQRQMTAYDAQIHCSGVQSVLDNENSFSRSLALSNGEKFFPVPLDSGLGFDFAYFSYYVRYTPAGLSTRGRISLIDIELLKNYIEQKQMHLLDLESHLSKKCIISPNNCY